MTAWLGHAQRVVTWGSWPDWITAGFTSLAFVTAARSYARSVKIRREAQARLVYSKPIDVKHHDVGAELALLPHGATIGVCAGGTELVPPSTQLAMTPVTELTAVIHNGSKELIGPAKLQVVNTGREATYDTFAALVGVIDPESECTVTFTFPNSDYPGQPSLGTTVLFRDASGSWWRRHLAEPIESVWNDPENASPTAAERAQYAAIALAAGLHPTPEPHVSQRVRWHRYWRKRRGKSR